MQLLPSPHRHHLEDTQRIAHVGSWEREIATGRLWWSDESCRILGIEPGTFEGTLDAFISFVHPDDRHLATPSDAQLAAGATLYSEYRIVRPDGTIRVINEIAEIIRDTDGTPIRLMGTTQDITERVEAEQDRARLASAVEQTADSIWMQDLDNSVTYVNRAFTRVYGYKPGEIVGKHAGIVDSGNHRPEFFDDIWATAALGRTWTGPIVNRRKDGTLFEVDAVISGIKDANGRLIGYIQTDRDVTRERALESALERDARERQTIESALAGIDSSATPEEIAATACAEIVASTNVETALVLILEPDDGWVLANVGRDAGVVPTGMAIPSERLAYLRERAAGGPWVESWRPVPVEYDIPIGVTQALHSRAYAPFAGPGDTLGVIGIVAYDPVAADQLVERLPALATFGSIIGTLIRPGIKARRRETADRSALKGIIDAAAFRPFFQPIVDLWDGSVVGHEALTRFADGRAPNLVFGDAARAGLGIELETACLRASLAASQHLPPNGYLSLNTSPELVLSGGLGSILAAVSRPVVLEITEHVEIDDYPGLRRELERLGSSVRLAVDDAGAGYASFRHILELAPDFVKIDLDLVRGVDAEPARQALIAGMGYFAVKRKLRLVAEGIETRKELDALQALAVPYGQGYLLGRPRDGSSPGSAGSAGSTGSEGSEGSAGSAGSWPTRIDLPAFPHA